MRDIPKAYISADDKYLNPDKNTIVQLERWVEDLLSRIEYLEAEFAKAAPYHFYEFVK